MSGHVSAEIDNAVWECEGPVAITIHPSVVHGFAFSEEAVGFVLTVDQNVVFAVGSSTGADSQTDIFATLFVQPLAIDLQPVPEVRERLEALLRNLIAESAWPLFGHTLMLEWLARSALLLLVRLHADHRSADQSGRHDFELFSRFRTLVEQHYKDQWQISQYAASLRVTPSRLNRLCLKLSGDSPSTSPAALMLELPQTDLCAIRHRQHRL